MGCAASRPEIAASTSTHAAPAPGQLSPSSTRARATMLKDIWEEVDADTSDDQARQAAAATPATVGHTDMFSLIHSQDLQLGPLLGAGITGRVYKGSWQGRPVAIKVMAHGWRHASRMMREMQLSTQLQHPNVVRSFLHFTVETKTQSLVPPERLQAQPAPPAPAAAPLDAGAASLGAAGHTSSRELIPVFTTSSSAHRFDNASSSDVTATLPSRDAISAGAVLTQQKEGQGACAGASDVHAQAGYTYEVTSSTGLASGAGIEEGLDDDDPFLGPPASSGELFGPETTFVSNVCAEGEDQLQSIIVQEYCDCGALATALGQGRRFRHASGHMDVRLVLLRAREVAVGLQYLHAMGCVHGDLKGENVLLRACPADPTGVTAVLADFGLSAVLADGKSHKITRSLGTVAYMAPEMLLRGELTARSDIYSFGMLLHELMTCEPPFRGMMAGEVVQQVVMNDARPIFPEHTPHSYAKLAKDCWQRDRHKRPTAAQVVARLDELLPRAQALQSELQQQAVGLTGYL